MIELKGLDFTEYCKLMHLGSFKVAGIELERIFFNTDFLEARIPAELSTGDSIAEAASKCYQVYRHGRIYDTLNEDKNEITGVFFRMMVGGPVIELKYEKRSELYKTSALHQRTMTWKDL